MKNRSVPSFSNIYWMTSFWIEQKSLLYMCKVNEHQGKQKRKIMSLFVCLKKGDRNCNILQCDGGNDHVFKFDLFVQRKLIGSTRNLV